MHCFEVQGYVTETMKYKLHEAAAQFRENYTRHDSLICNLTSGFVLGQAITASLPNIH